MERMGGRHKQQEIKMNYAALKTDLASRFPGVTDPAQVAASMNTLTVTSITKNTLVRLRTLDWLFPDPVECQGIIDSLNTTANAMAGSGVAATSATGKRLQRAISYMNGTGSDDGIDVGNGSVRTLIDQLAAGSVITTAQAAILKGYAEATASYAVAAYGRSIDFADVQEAWRQ